MKLNGGGYMFINPKYLKAMKNDEVQAMFSDKKSFLMRVQKPDKQQPYAVLSQLPKYQYVCAYDMIFSKHSAPDLGLLTEYLCLGGAVV